VFWRTGRRSEAEVEYRQAVEIYQRLADANPTVIDFRSSLALNRNNLGELLWQTGRASEAEAECRAGLAIQRVLADEHPKIPVLRNAVGAGLTTIADLFRSLGRLAEARDGYEQAIAIGAALVREVPDETWYRSNLACALRRRGLVRRDQGDPAGAVADARKALLLYDELPKKSGEQWYETACCHAALAGLAGSPGTGVSAGSGPSEADVATDLLRRAVGMGYRDRDTFRTDAALASLRDREDFRLLLMDLAFPPEPFATARWPVRGTDAVGCAKRQQRPTRGSGGVSGVRGAIPGGLIGSVVVSGPSSRSRSCGRARRRRLSYPIAQSLQFAASGVGIQPEGCRRAEEVAGP
jgi:tetratricopeptide (TPR) repeat protein